MQIVTQEKLKELVEGSKDIAKVISGVTTDLTNEAINLFIVDGLLSILKFSVVFVVFFVVKKYCDVLAEQSAKDEKDARVFKGLKTAALVISMVFFTSKSFPHVQNIAKALVAPKLFIIEKSKELIHENK